MTQARRSVYARSWFNREIKIDMRNRKKEYNRKVRHMKIDADACSRGVIKNTRKLCWDTMS